MNNADALPGPRGPEPNADLLQATFPDLAIYPRSITPLPSGSCFLARREDAKVLGVLSSTPEASEPFSGTTSTVRIGGQSAAMTVLAPDATSAAVLRRLCPFLAPRPLGLVPSAGCGDRLGLATPGHLRAFRRSPLAPVLAQQSMRENARTGRTPQAVVDDALWGVLQEGWRHGFGADADHLKTPDEIDRCAAAGFTLYTIDSSEHVDNEANTAPREVLERKVASIPWAQLETTWADTARRFATPIDLGSLRFTAADGEWLRAAAKYGRALAHTLQMHRHLQAILNGRPFDLEVSIDESETVTTLAEHIYIASELRRLGVTCVSLAPRYVGEFLKGVDYIGDLSAFERSFSEHLAVARTFGPYKLSLHSGSDKFSIYPIAARLAGDLVHLKTSGTSYLEALRAVATLDPRLFREIVAFARDCYPSARVGYHVLAEAGRMPDVWKIRDMDLPAVLDHFDTRQVVHVAFGALFHEDGLRRRLFETLRANEEVYYAVLEAHFDRHFAPFAGVGPRRAEA